MSETGDGQAGCIVAATALQANFDGVSMRILCISHDNLVLTEAVFNNIDTADTMVIANLVEELE